MAGALGVAAGCLVFVGMSYLPPAEAIALYSTAPFWSILFSYLVTDSLIFPTRNPCLSLKRALPFYQKSPVYLSKDPFLLSRRRVL